MIETERLELIALTDRQLRLWLEDINTLEEELRCTYRGEPLLGVFRDIVSGQLSKMEADAANFRYRSFWFIQRKCDRVVVGVCDFKNPPDEKAEVEIGYGMGKEFEGAGYMTEAIRAFCNWALAQKEIRSVTAETEPDNLKSEGVLARVGFVPDRRDTNNWWRLSAQC